MRLKQSLSKNKQHKKNHFENYIFYFYYDIAYDSISALYLATNRDNVITILVAFTIYYILKILVVYIQVNFK